MLYCFSNNLSLIIIYLFIRGDEMETTINRKDYRREYRENDETHFVRLDGTDTTNSKVGTNGKTISVMLLFLSVLLLKFFRI